MEDSGENEKALFQDAGKALFRENGKELFIESGSRDNVGGQSRTAKTEAHYAKVAGRMVSRYTRNHPELPPEAATMASLADAAVSIIVRKSCGEISKRTWRVYKAALGYVMENFIREREGFNPPAPQKEWNRLIQSFTRLKNEGSDGGRYRQNLARQLEIQGFPLDVTEGTIRVPGISPEVEAAFSRRTTILMARKTHPQLVSKTAATSFQDRRRAHRARKIL